MDDIAIIAAAGWKGAGRGGKLVKSPVPFWPLGKGTTPLSRLSGQLKSLGFRVMIVVGALGYPFKDYQPRGGDHVRYDAGVSVNSILEEIGIQLDDSPWTPERHAYAATLGKIVVTPDPGWSNQHNSFCEAMDCIDSDYHHLVLVCGDTIFSPSFLGEVFNNLPWPSQFGMHPNHAIFLLDKGGAEIYRRYAEGHRKRPCRAEDWPAYAALQPDGGRGTGLLEKLGIKHGGWHSPKWKHLQDWSPFWLDIDHLVSYQEIIDRIAAGNW